MAWRPIGGVDFGRLREARLQAHHAVQWLARAARAFVPPHADDRHTNLDWDDALGGFVTHPLKDDLRLGLCLTELRLTLVTPSVQVSFPLDGHTDADVRQRLGDLLAAHDLDPAPLDAKPPYEIADHKVAHGGAYDTGSLGDAFSGLAAWFANADLSLGHVRDQMIAHKFAPSPVRTWPHHFDMATLTPLETGGAEHARSVDAGFSPGDEHYGEPYFYVSPHPYPDVTKLSALPLGRWHTQGFTAAVLPAGSIVATNDSQAAGDAFLDAAVTAAITVL
ncbi:MAG: hypothetical protein JO328_16055 [Hyphomicrobiales bacterium]|nr:hypothetical protein [Hyphomicrobiales bacterium]MBV9428410.1 hypothetical protein [Bradyrhizobiaceae bacterium]